MTPQTLAVDDIASAEAELARLESEVQLQLQDVKERVREANEQIIAARRNAEDPALASALAQLKVPSLSLKSEFDEGRLARLKALNVRRSCMQRAQQAISSHQAVVDDVVAQALSAEQTAKQRALQRSAEVAAQEARRAQAAQAARAAQAAEVAHAAAEEDSLAATMIRALDAPSASAPAAKPTTDMRQRRAAVRASLCAEISLASDSNFFTGFTNDVSEGGVFVATVNLLPLGTQIDLSFSLPSGARIEGKGEVRWIRDIDEKHPEVFPGMGIRFVDLPSRSVSAIHAFTQQREPLFFPEA